jgi:hypothetical protein
VLIVSEGVVGGTVGVAAAVLEAAVVESGGTLTEPTCRRSSVSRANTL